MSKKISLEIAEEKINIELLFDETKSRFAYFAGDYVPNEKCVGLKQSEIENGRKFYSDKRPDSAIEYNRLLLTTISELLKRGISVFHALAIIWHGKAWLFAAPSGTGKTTQFKQWVRQYRSEIELLNGDKVALKVEPNGSVTVYPTPWAGKEGMSGKKSASLGGVIFLEQSDKNEITRLTPEEARPLLCKQFLLSERDLCMTDVLDRARDAMLGSASLWLLKNLGDPDSAKLTHDTIEKSSEVL